LSIDLTRLGIKSLEKLRRILIEARDRLEKEKVTATDWLGRFFEVVGPSLPEVRAIEQIAVEVLRKTVNRFVGTQKSASIFTNGYFEKVIVKKRFVVTEVAYNIRIRLPGQAVGIDFPDRATFVANADGQRLFPTMELKTRGAAGGLLEQVAAKVDRLSEAAKVDGAKLTYNVEGKQGPEEIDLKDLVLLEDIPKAELRECVRFLSNIGVRAGRRFKVVDGIDAHGKKYIRIVTPYPTDVIRRLLERLLRDKRWQGP
jgi:hypothetical protein